MGEHLSAIHDSVNDDAIYTPSEVALMAKVSEGQVKLAIQYGRLRAFKMGRNMIRTRGSFVRKWVKAGAPAERSISTEMVRELISRCGPADGTIYFAKSMEFVKIGFTSDLGSRLHTLRCSNPMPIDLLGTTEGNIIAEKAVHRLLRDRRHRLEWFHLTPELQTIIKELCG